jgi:hypothetical protein
MTAATSTYSSPELSGNPMAAFMTRCLSKAETLIAKRPPYRKSIKCPSLNIPYTCKGAPHFALLVISF